MTQATEVDTTEVKPDRRWAILALLLLVPVPSLGTSMAMVVTPGSIGQIIFAVCKVWLLVLPVAWWLVVERQRPSWSPLRQGGMLVGAALGTAVGGIIALAYLFVVVGGSLLLFALRAPSMVQGSDFKGVSRETLLLINNLMLVVMTAMVLTGTLYPLLLDALDAGKISVGPPYFSLMFAILMVPIAFFLSPGFHAKWQEDSIGRLARKLAVPAVFAVLSGASTAIWLPNAGAWGIAGSAAAGWIIVANIAYAIERFRRPPRPGRGETGMILAHLGVGLFLIGASLTNAISTEKHLRMQAGDQFEMSGYTFVFQGTHGVEGPNFVADQGEFIVLEGEQEITRMYPQKRRYRSGQTMTEAALDPGLTRDLYVSLGEPLDSFGRAWAVRIYHKPFVRFIWLGALIMMFGGFLAASDRRYRRERKEATA